MKQKTRPKPGQVQCVTPAAENAESEWIRAQPEAELQKLEDLALAEEFGTELERKLVREARSKGKLVRESGALRHCFIRRFAESRKPLTNGSLS